MQFRLGSDGATELTEDQVLDQLRLYTAAIRIADRFACDTIGIQYDPGSQGIRREDYRVALEAVHNYVQKENLFPGLWSLPEVFEAHGEYSIEGILDWIYALYD
jgi:hypothetical protein